MRLAAIACLILSCNIAAIAQNPHASKWPTKDNVYVIKNFHFGTGETIAELSLHYLTLGQPHRVADGQARLRRLSPSSVVSDCPNDQVSPPSFDLQTSMNTELKPAEYS